MKVLTFVSLLAAAAAVSFDLPPHHNLNFTTAESGNPLFDGWFADPEIRVYDNVFWIFPTTSVAFKDQKHFNAWSSIDLVHWKKYPEIFTVDSIPWIKDSLWAPTSAKGPDGKYYLYFSSFNGVKSGPHPGAGLAVAVADKPQGPYRDALDGKRLLDHAVHGGNPMDPDVFTDDDGQRYLYFGGTNGNVALLNDDMISFRPVDNSSSAKGTDAEFFKRITPRPSSFEEGLEVFKRNGIYYMMWSEHGYGEARYQVAYGTSDSPLGPIRPKGVILQQDPAIAVATGHHSVLNIPGTDIWYIVYHRRSLREARKSDNRVVAMDRLHFHEDGAIKQVELLVKDDFDDGHLSNVLWQMRSGQWSLDQATETALHGDAHNNMGASQPALTLMDTRFHDLVYDADVALEDDSSEAGITFRTEPSKDKNRPEVFRGYAVWLSGRTGEILLGHQTHDARVAVLMSVSGVEVGRYHHLRVEFRGKKLSVFLDDAARPTMTVENAADGSGQNGLWVKTGFALFDNISIRHP